jgi:N-acetylneuraminate synthase
MKLKEIITENYDSLPNYIYVVAEIGINHNGSVEAAKKMIDIAKQSGCDAVKFQKRDLELVYSNSFLNEPRDSPWGTTQGDQKRKLEFGYDEYQELYQYTKLLNLDFSASAWDENSLIFLDSFPMDFQKVASALVSNKKFLSKVAERSKITLLSLGMCDWEMADDAIKIFDSLNCPVIPMHCVSTYPALDSELNLIQIKSLQERYERVVGYSGHESSVSPSIIAATLGARVIERHITLDRAMYGSDQSASLEFPGIQRLVGSLRKFPIIYGNKEKIISDRERIVAKKLRYWEND